MSVLTLRSSTFIALAVALSLAASAFLLSSGTSSAETNVGPVVVLEPDAPDVALPGQQIRVVVWSNPENGAEPAGWDFNVGYDPSRVDVLDVQSALPAVSAQGNPIPPCAFASNDQGGHVAIALVCNQPVGEPVPLAVVWFQISPNAQPGDVLDFGVFDSEVGSFDPNNVQLIDSVGLDTSVLIIGGVCGDQNNDGKVDILDAILDFKFAVGIDDPTPVQQYLSDLDGIGGINVIDVIILLQHIVGILDIERTGCGPIDDRLGSIHGYKFDDKNMNGLWDDGEPPMAGWTITLWAPNGDGGLDFVADTVTMHDDPETDWDETGMYWFPGLFPSDYIVTEERRPGWHQSWPASHNAWMNGDQEVPPIGTDARGQASINLIQKDQDGTWWIKFGVRWEGIQTPTTGLHIHVAPEGTNGPVIYNLADIAGEPTSGFDSPVSGMFQLVEKTVAGQTLTVQDQVHVLNNGGMYVNLHSEDNPPGEIRGQVWPMHRQHYVSVFPRETVENVNFGNWTEEVEPPDENPCGCIIGIFEDDQTHDWWVQWNGSATTADDLMIKVVASSVNPDESGTIVATIEYGDGSSDSVTVDHPTGTDATTNPDNVGWLDIDESKIVPGQSYSMTVSYSGSAHHYKLGWKAGQEHDLWLGTNNIRYNEGVSQHWGVDAQVGETVDLEFWNDDPNMGANQTGQLEVEIVDPSGTTIYGPTSLTLAPNTPETVTFTASIEGMYTVKMIQNQGPGAGHYRVVRLGTDAHLWLLPCPEQEPPEETGSIHGFKFEDLNGNGVQDAGEPGVAGVQIDILDHSGAVIATTHTMDDTDPNDGDMTGWFWIDVPPGDYVVREIPPAGWTPTTPVEQNVHVEADTQSSTVLASHNEFDCGYTLYVANEGNGGGGQTIVAVDCNGNVSPFAIGFNGTSGLAVNTAGEMFASDDRPGVYQVDTAGNVTQLLPHPGDSENPNALSIDSSGRLLVGDSGAKVLRLTVSGGAITGVEVLADGFAVPQGVVEDPANGNIYFTDGNGFVYVITPADTLPVVPPGVATLPIGPVAPANEGNLVMDAAGNLYFSDFNDRIIRVGFGTAGDPSTASAKDVVDLTDNPCPPNQAGRDRTPGFRGFVFDTEGDLVVTGYCEDEIYIFQASELQNAWDTGTPITTLPPPFAENPSLDGILNGPFGMVFKEGAPDPNPDPDDPDVTFGNMRVPDDTGSIHGWKWEDTNGNGIWDDGEQGLAGVDIVAMQDGQVVASAVTMADDTSTTGEDETGMYWIEDLAPGDYVVKEQVDPNQWMQTYPVTWQAGLSHDSTFIDSTQTGAGGLARFVRQPDGSIEWWLFWNGLSGTPSNAHIHSTVDGVASGGVIQNLWTLRDTAQDTANSAHGTFTLGSSDLLDDMDNGKAYVNIHTSANPGGEVAGLIVGDGSHHVTVVAGGEVPDINFGNKPVGPAEEWDFGDLPDDPGSSPVTGPGNYRTLLVNDGARHKKVDENVILGDAWDKDADGQPTANADGDDTDAGGDDEDGVTFTTALVAGGSASVDVTVTGTAIDAHLDAWIDFNADGDFDDTIDGIDEHILFAFTAIPNGGAQAYSFNIPASAKVGTTYARFRVRTDTDVINWFGPWPNGEVEDYKINIEEASTDLPDLLVVLTGISATLNPGSELGPLGLTVSNQGTATGHGTVDSNGAGQDPPPGYNVDLVISSDQSVPAFASRPGFSDTFQEDALLQGGRVSRTLDVVPANSVNYPQGAPVHSVVIGSIPVNIAPGTYFICAVVDSTEVITESNEANNVHCVEVQIVDLIPK